MGNILNLKTYYHKLKRLKREKNPLPFYLDPQPRGRKWPNSPISSAARIAIFKPQTPSQS